MGVPDSADAYGYANRRPALYETTQLIDWVYSSFSVQAALDPDQALLRSQSSIPPRRTPCCSTPTTR